ncbi:hypothetical protein JX265_005174 [Neoarthrinium moseri]|uniref:O-methyltransferase domain-containing protein n=1 Tax=Neoarthrinium moseri TaxID=1658444 RepID=A0A9Q0AQH8_9PEZI|nr:hypothetical protein JX266_010735 [Neoarthrinium moseri]KAI1873552.1 hypothetical protein JX265_005174 [Neoarthrinium moseri]
MSGFSKDNISQALSQVAAEGNDFLNGQPGSREKLIASARDLIAVAESPVESLLWSIWAQPTRTVAARIAVDLKIFETAVQDDGRPKTDYELAAPTGASPELVKRIARVCVSMRMLDEKGPGLYVPNGLTHVLTQPEYAAGIVFCFDSANPSFAQMPAYLRSTRFQNPGDPVQGPFQYAHKCGHAFGWLLEHPDTFEAFHGYVHALRVHRPSWFEMYPVQERLLDGLKPEGDASALVDIGGGTGQILEDFHASVPHYTGRLVLQDLPEVIATASGLRVGKDPRFELQTHDFFTEQPIKGARAYFMRSVLHDWPDDKCRIILKHLKDAMEPGYSRILVSDCIVADERAAWQHLSLDIFMMALASSQERTAKEWHELVESCGLKITGFYNKGQGNEGLIEIAHP